MAWISRMSSVTSLRLPPVRETASGMSALQTRTPADDSTSGGRMLMQTSE
jgi:hypothetical protein